MDAERWSRLREIVEAALRASSSEWPEILQAASQGDEELRSLAERMLAEDSRPGELIDVSLQGALARARERALEGSHVGGCVGAYRLERFLGAGGMGEVYLALRTEEFEQRVAVKLIRLGMATGEILQRFQRERQVLADLEHPGIARLLDGGSTPDGRPYLVLEYVEGLAIDRWCNERQLGLRARVGLFLEVCAAVQYAHQKLVVHRDLKPSNILVGSDGRPKLLDFGIAKVLAPEGSGRELERTGPGERHFTPRYASPEQVRGERTTTQSDVYSLGVLLYELLTGRRPYSFAGDDPSSVARTVCEQPARTPSSAVARPRAAPSDPSSFSPPDHDPTRLGKHLAGDLDTILLAALCKEPERRYASVEQLAGDLRRHLAHLPLVARADTVRYRTAKFVRRNRLSLSIAAAVAMALVSALAISLRASHRAQVARAEEAAQRRIAEWQAYVANIAAAEAAIRANDVADARIRLDRAPEALRGWEWTHLAARTDRSERTIAAHSQAVRCLAFSPDGSLLASSSNEPTIRLWDARTGELRSELPGHEGEVTSVRFSPDGRSLVSGSVDRCVLVWDLRTCRPGPPFTGHTERVNGVAFSADGARIASASIDHSVRIWDAQGAEEPLVLRGHEDGVNSVAFSPDGELLASSANDGMVVLWSVVDGSEIGRLSGDGQPLTRLAFQPDGARLAAGSTRGDVFVWITATGALAHALRGHGALVEDVCFSPDGEVLASAAWDRTVRLWDVRSGRERAVLRGHTDNVLAIAFAPDGRSLASGSFDGTIKSWDAACADVPMLPWPAWNGVAAFSPDGSRLAADVGGIVRLWDLPSRGEASTLPSEKYATCVVFAPLGSLIAVGTASGEVEAWNAGSRARVATLEGHDEAVLAVAFRSDGARLASASRDSTVRIWNMESLEQAALLEGHSDPVSCVAFAPGGDLLASGSSDGNARLWSGSNWSSLGVLAAGSPINSLVFAADGARLAVGCADGVIRVFDVASRALVGELRGHAHGVTSLASSPDGSRLASASLDYTVRLWDPRSSCETATLHGHTSFVWSVAFSPDGRWLASVSSDQTIRLWNGGE